MVSNPIVGIIVTLGGLPQWDRHSVVGGWNAGRSAVAAGRRGDFLVAFEDEPPAANVNLYGALWGRRVYLPLLLKSRGPASAG